MASQLTADCAVVLNLQVMTPLGGSHIYQLLTLIHNGNKITIVK